MVEKGNKTKAHTRTNEEADGNAGWAGSLFSALLSDHRQVTIALCGMNFLGGRGKMKESYTEPVFAQFFVGFPLHI